MLGIICKEMSYVNRYQVDMKEMTKSMKKFEHRFGCLSDLKTGDKLSYDANNKLYISSYGYLQGVSRWYYSQSRTNVFKQFEEQIKEFILFLRYLFNSHLGYLRSNVETTQYKEIMCNANKLSGILINALYFLERTYKKDNKLLERLNILKQDIDYRNGQIKQYIQ